MEIPGPLAVPSGGERSEIAGRPATVRERLGFWGAAFARCTAPSPLGEAAPSLLLLEAGEIWRSHAAPCAATCAVRREVRPSRTHGGDEILIGAVLAGESRMRHRDVELSLRPGDVLAYDFTQPAEVRARAAAEIHLALPRAAVRSALGADPAELSGRVLSGHALRPFLFEQLALVARVGPSLGPMARRVAFDSLVLVALATLADEHAGRHAGRGAPRDRGEPGLFAAAERFVERNYASRELTPEGLAAALGCSRAQLYRVFARRGLAVAGYIQEVRLQRGWAALTGARAEQPRIGDVAFQCGFEDPVVFSRAFRRRFGLTPRDIREAHRAGAAE
jgi:AraC-like DNA-binding protein